MGKPRNTHSPSFQDFSFSVPRFGFWVKFPSFCSHRFGSLFFNQESLDSSWAASSVVPTQSPLFVKYKHIHVLLFPVPKAYFFSRLDEHTVKRRSLQYHWQAWGQCWADRPTVTEMLTLPVGGEQKFSLVCGFYSCLDQRLHVREKKNCFRHVVETS